MMKNIFPLLLLVVSGCETGMYKSRERRPARQSRVRPAVQSQAGPARSVGARLPAPRVRARAPLPRGSDNRKRAVEVLRKDRAKDAALLLRALARKKGKDLRILYLLGVAEMKCGHRERARKAFKRVVGLDPNLADGYAGLCQVNAQLKEPDRAAAACLKAMKLAPKRQEFREALSRIYFSQGKIEAGYALLKDSIANEHKKVGSLVELGRGYLARKQYDKAITALTIATFAVPERLDIASLLARAHFEKGDLIIAGSLWRRVIRRNQKHQQALDGLLAVYGRRRDGENMLAELKAMRQAGVNNAQLEKIRGFIELRMKNFFISEDVLSRVVEALPADTRARIGLAHSLIGLKRFDEAVHQLREAITQAPSDDEAPFLLGQLYNSLKNPQEALKAFALVLAAKGHRKAGAYRELGILELKGRLYGRAALHLAKAAELLKKDGRITFMLGQALERLGRFKEAKNAYHRTLALDIPLTLRRAASRAFARTAGRESR